MNRKTVTIEDIAKKIKSKDVSPVELVKSSVEKSEKTEDALNAYVRLNTEPAMDAARTALRMLSAFHILPLAPIQCLF